jgi:hypothetical protein
MFQGIGSYKNENIDIIRIRYLLSLANVESFESSVKKNYVIRFTRVPRVERKLLSVAICRMALKYDLRLIKSQGPDIVQP